MSKRSGIFLVKTHVWYVERMVWLIAGTLVLTSSVLTHAHSPNWTFVILAVALCSIMVALTGFCIVGNILLLLGVKPMIPRKASQADPIFSRLYFMQTDRWFLERYIYMFVGVNLTLSSMLARFYSPYWLFFTGFVGLATITFAFTGFCIMANLLYRLGCEPRLCRYI